MKQLAILAMVIFAAEAPKAQTVTTISLSANGTQLTFSYSDGRPQQVVGAPVQIEQEPAITTNYLSWTQPQPAPKAPVTNAPPALCAPSVSPAQSEPAVADEPAKTFWYFHPPRLIDVQLNANMFVGGRTFEPNAVWIINQTRDEELAIYNSWTHGRYWSGGRYSPGINFNSGIRPMPSTARLPQVRADRPFPSLS